MARSIGNLIGNSWQFTSTPLFPGGAGRVTSPDDFDSLMTDLERRIFDVYADETMVHPGHGKPTTLGVERPQLPEWWARRW
jgi:glyoxylase-like metal-dependent hydrolase (beta-lactamase superfamily II)